MYTFHMSFLWLVVGYHRNVVPVIEFVFSLTLVWSALPMILMQINCSGRILVILAEEYMSPNLYLMDDYETFSRFYLMVLCLMMMSSQEICRTEM